MTVEMVPRDQLQACAAANRMLRDELARVERERDALLVVLRAALAYETWGHGGDAPYLAIRDFNDLRAALAPFRKDGPHTQESPAVAGSSQPAPEGTT